MFALALLLAAAPPQAPNPLDAFWYPVNDRVIYDLDGDTTGTTDDQIRANGNLGLAFSSLLPGATLNDAGDDLDSFSLGLELHLSAALQIEADADATLSALLPVTGVPVVLPPLIFPVGDLTITITPTASVLLAVEGTAAAGVSFDFTWSQSVPVGLSYDQGVLSWTPASGDPWIAAATPEIPGSTGLGLSVRPFLGLALAVQIQGFPVPFVPQFGSDAGLGFSVQPQADPWWSLDAEGEVLASIGPSLTTPAWVPWSPLLGWSLPVADAGGPFPGAGVGAHVRWTRAYDSNPASVEVATCLVPSPATPGGWIVGGNTGLGGAFLEVDEAGVPVGGFQVASLTSAFVPTDATASPDGPVFVGTDDLLALDNAGNLRWHMDLDRGPAVADVKLNGVDADGQGGYYAAGSAYVPTASGTTEWRPLLLRLDNGGNVLWSRFYLDPVGLNAGFMDVKAAPDGGAVAVGTARTPDVGTGSWGASVVKVDANGDPEWQYVLTNNEHTAKARAVDLGPNGEVWVAGILDRNINFTDPYNLLVWKLDLSGLSYWALLYAEEADNGNAWNNTFDQAYDILADGDGAIVLGSSAAIGVPDDALMWRVGPNGDTTWFKSWRGVGGDTLRAVAHTDDGGLIAAGETGSFAVAGVSSNGHYWIAKTGAEGFVQWDPALQGGAALTPERRLTGLIQLPGAFTLRWDPAEAVTYTTSPVTWGLIPYSWVDEDLTRR